MTFSRRPTVRFLIVALAFLIVVSSVTSVRAFQYSVGVGNGAWATFTETLNYNGSITIFPTYPGASMSPGAARASLNVSTADGSIILLTTDAHYRNSTSPPSTGQFPINVTQGWGSNEPPFFLAAAIPNGFALGMDSPGNTIPVTKTEFNEGIAMYPIGSSIQVSVYRNVNYLIISIVNAPEGSYDITTQATYRWDQQTGTPVSIKVQQWARDHSPSQTIVASYLYSLRIQRTNIWPVTLPSAPPGTQNNPPPGSGGLLPFGLGFTELYVLGGVVAALALGVIAAVWRRGPKKSGRSTRLSQKNSRSRARDR